MQGHAERGTHVHRSTPGHHSTPRCALRDMVLRLGGLLGWSPREVIAFTEALTGRPWRRCGPAEYRLALAEYRTLAEAGAARRARREGADHARRH